MLWGEKPVVSIEEKNAVQHNIFLIIITYVGLGTYNLCTINMTLCLTPVDQQYKIFVTYVY